MMSVITVQAALARKALSIFAHLPPGIVLSQKYLIGWHEKIPAMKNVTHSTVFNPIKPQHQVW